jgi:uncharacterized protein YbaA (DUF1428 family)
MTYIEGFVAAVPAANKEMYRKHAADAAPLFKEFGVTRMVETWGDEVPDGEVTDLKRAVKARPDEVVVFSWFEYPSKEARNAANEKIMNDPRMKQMGTQMPFDGRRMIFGGFSSIVDARGTGRTGYVEGSLVPVPAGNKDAYRDMAATTAEILREHGAARIVAAWGDDVPDGKVTDYKGAVKARDGETVAYAWIEWPSKQARDEGWKKAVADPRMRLDRPFDRQRQIYGGFTPIVDA